jgi:hypothetical protein
MDASRRGVKEDSYTRYVRAYGKGTSGSRATDRDYGRTLWLAFIPFSQAAQVAVSLGLSDAMADKPLRTKTEMEQELRRLLG